jgi:hypothetical protein
VGLVAMVLLSELLVGPIRELGQEGLLSITVSIVCSKQMRQAGK